MGEFDVEVGVVVVDDDEAEDPGPELVPVEAPLLVPDVLALDVLELAVLGCEVLS